jgi:hypothetical protein
MVATVSTVRATLAVNQFGTQATEAEEPAGRSWNVVVNRSGGGGDAAQPSGASPPKRLRRRRTLNCPARLALDPAYISAFSALAGALIGSLASFSTSWVTQRTQIRHTQSEAERARLEALYSEFITESARLLGDALSNQKDDIADMVGLYALVGRMRLVSSPAVVAAADQIIIGIITTYQGPNLALHEMHEYVREGRMNYLVQFGEAARADLAHRR